MDDTKMSEQTSESVSRRGFIKGVIAAGAVASSSAYLFRTTPLLGQPSAPGSVERLITLNVNGQDRRVDVMKQETLAMTLRYKLGLTGTKLGCDRAECGACTVLIDDVPHYSCSVLTHTTRGKKVQTIEGLADPTTGKLSAVQQHEGDVSGAFGVQAYPTNYVIGPDGKVIWCGVGYDPAMIRGALASTLEPAGS